VALVLRPLTSPRVCAGAAIAAVGGSALVAGRGVRLLRGARRRDAHPLAGTWLAFTPTFAGKVGVIADDLSMVLVMVVTGVSLLVHVYSTGYLHGEPGYPRYFARSTCSPARCSRLVLSVSILQIYVFWSWSASRRSC